MYDLIIIGGGPAGLTAALYSLRANKKVLVIESGVYGGQIVKAHKIENYPGIHSISGAEYAISLYEQVKNLGAEFKSETVIHVNEDKTVITNLSSYQAKAVIIATGAGYKKLQIDNEENFIGKGISYCATCDGNFFKNKTVAVVGGGDTAIKDAIYLSDIVKKLYVIHRRDSFRCEDKTLDELKSKENVEFILNSNVIKLNGDNLLESIEVKNNDGSISTIELNGLFIAVGQEPKNGIFTNLVNIDKAGYIESEDGVHTNVEGIYVAGDARQKELRQLTTAVSDGSIAATIAIKEMK